MKSGAGRLEVQAERRELCVPEAGIRGQTGSGEGESRSGALQQALASLDALPTSPPSFPSGDVEHDDVAMYL